MVVLLRHLVRSLSCLFSVSSNHAENAAAAGKKRMPTAVQEGGGGEKRRELRISMVRRGAREMMRTVRIGGGRVEVGVVVTVVMLRVVIVVILMRMTLM